jgi:GABA(A) receptor-associated protein
MNKIEYKQKIPFEKRLLESTTIQKKYPDRIPIICENIGQQINTLLKKKYLVPNQITLGQFLIIIRKRLKLTQEQAIFCFIDNKLHPISRMIGDLYNKYKDDDGFLYILYSGENCFG